MTQISRKSITEILDDDEKGQIEDEHLDDGLWLFLSEHITTPQDAKIIPKPVLAYFASRYIQWEVGNGGFVQAAYNIPEWFKFSAWAYNKLGLQDASERIKTALSIIENEELSSQSVEDELEKLDSQLDDIGWWADELRLKFVRNHRDAFREVVDILSR